MRRPYDDQRHPRDDQRRQYDSQRRPYDEDRRQYDSQRRPYDEDRRRDDSQRRLYDSELKKRRVLVSDKLGYSDQLNPFNDDALSRPFVWDKKAKTESSLEETERRLLEIRNVRARREQRARPISQPQRPDNEQLYEAWTKVENQFHRSVATLRNRLRIREKREDVFDWFLKEIDIALGIDFEDMTLHPLTAEKLLESVSTEKLKKAMEDVRSRLKLDLEEVETTDTVPDPVPSSVDDLPRLTRKQMEEKIHFWRAILAIGRHELEKQTVRKLTPFVEQRLLKSMTDKTEEQLDELAIVVEETLQKEGVDVDYWESVKERLPYFRGVAIVKRIRERALHRCSGLAEITEEPVEAKPEVKVEETTFDEPSWSLLPPRVEREVTKDDEDVFAKFVAREKELTNDDEMILEGQEEEVFVSGVKLIKPRYFNRIKTGFEWNRYNQTHYDQDNPPPRIVQGYRFSIFYPARLDNSHTPKWRLLPSESNDDTVILRFSGGPPYQDLTFKIVNREWDLNPRRGYRNCFDRNILHLHFNFKRLRYRK